MQVKTNTSKRSLSAKKPKPDSPDAFVMPQSSVKLATKKKKKTLTPLASLASSFYVLPLHRTSVLDNSQPYVKYLYVKAREIDGIATLIVSNISIEDTKDSLRILFEALSELKVTHVEIGKDRLAVLKFEGVIDLEESFLKRISQEDCLSLPVDVSSPSNIGVSCVEKWLAEYKTSRPDRITISRDADERMAEIEHAEEEHRQMAKQPQVDEDGFTLVAPKKRKLATKISGGDNTTKKQKLKEPEPKRKRLMDENLSFYKFERRRQRNAEVAKLKIQMKNDIKRADRLRVELASST